MRFVFNKRPSVKSGAPILLFFSLLLAGCSAEKNTVASKAFHNLASHYNGYFYAKEEMDKIEIAYFKSMTDDYNRILRLYPKLDSTQSKPYEKEFQEVVKMASLAIQHHKNSKWVDDSYILIGKARLYALDWGNAIQTFKFVNTNSKDKDARHEAILNLVRTFTEHKEFNNARAAADFLQKAELTDAHKKQLLLEKAYLAQSQNDLDNMVRNLTEVAPMLRTKADRPGRIYFILGQTYQKLGFEAEAYNYYRKCLSTHPEYEVDFYARLYMAQVTEISQSKNINTARKSFKKLLKDTKNRDFKDKIYYEMGVFEYKQKNIEQSIAHHNSAIRIGNNKRVDGEAYLRLGEMYYDTRKYELSQAYYDSAVSSLPADYENLEGIKKRQLILDEFVKHLNTIRWQDSLLTLSTMDTAALRAHVSTIVKANLKKEDNSKKKKKANRVDIDQVSTNIFGSVESNEASDGSTWYFANASVVALGQSEFTRIWGNIPLEDNWRRSQRTITTNQSAAVTANTSESQTSEGEAPASVDPVGAAMAKIISELPDTEEKKQEAYKKIEDAYYFLGDIYSLQLAEPENAIETYETLLKRFPESDYTADVLYRLYILTKESNPEQATAIATLLKEKYPDSSWTKILLNPDYLTEAGKTAVRQQALYAVAYKQYQLAHYDSASLVLSQAHAAGISSFTPNLTLLQLMILGQKREVAAYKTGLEEFIRNYPENELKKFAEQLLNAAKQSSSANAEAPPLYELAAEAQHLYVMVYSPDPTLEQAFASSVADFNRKNFPTKVFAQSSETLNEEKKLYLVADFSNRSSAIDYIKLFNEKLSVMSTLKNYNFNNFVITQKNLETLKRTQALNEYLSFYTRHYQTESQ